jgi:4-hydroxybenzoate polyprenyltransferase
MLMTELRRIFLHIRWPVQSYVLMGFFFGMAIAGVPITGVAVLAFFSWLLLCAGLTVFNSYYDKDEDPVGGLTKPPEVRISLLYGSIVLELIGLVMAFFVNPVFFYLSVAMAIVYFFYSHRSFRFKSNGFAAVFFNSGLGVATVVAAASLGGDLGRPQIIAGAAAAALFKASVYMMMQVHQIEEDKKRGDRSIAVIFGRQTTLKAAMVCMVLGGALIAAALYLASGSWLLPILTLLYVVFLIVLFVRWIPRDADVRRDMQTMSSMIYVSGYLGSVVCFIVYFYLGSWGAS